MADPYSYGADLIVRARLDMAAIENARPRPRKRHKFSPTQAVRATTPRFVWALRLNQRPA